MIFNLMNANNKTIDENDYPVAKALNESVNSIFFFILSFQTIGTHKEYSPDELNRAYLFLVNELEMIYDRNPKLAELKPEPTWRKFDIIKDKIYVVQKYLEEHDTMKDHILQIEKLCILSEHETPKLSLNQTKYIENTKILSDKYMGLIIEKIEENKEDAKEEHWMNNPRNLRIWCVENYRVEYKPDGTILVNDVLTLKKIHAGSTAERLLEQCVKSPNKLFKPNLGQTARNLSTVLSSAGFKPSLRDIFFPIVSEENGVIFRPTVGRDQLLKDRIDTYEIDSVLYNAGAEKAPRPKEELHALGFNHPDDED